LLAQCLLACGAATDAAASLARQYGTPTSRLVLAHHAESERHATTKKRKRASSTTTST
jgi:hypothetical protein